MLRAIHLSPGPKQPAGQGPHWFINGPLREWREWMAAHFRSSWLRCMDESGPPWHGGEGEGDYNLCPHRMYIPRKPEPLCAEFNTAGSRSKLELLTLTLTLTLTPNSNPNPNPNPNLNPHPHPGPHPGPTSPNPNHRCSASRIVDTIEFEMAAKYHADTKYVGTHTGSYNAALAMRMAEVGKGSNLLQQPVVYGDARFGGVKSAYFIMKEFGVHSAWDVKTMTALFPKAELVRITPKEHGAFVVMQAEISEGFPPGKKVTLYAIGQRRGPKVPNSNPNPNPNSNPSCARRRQNQPTKS